MNLVLDIVFWLLGLVLAVQVIAGWYSLIDLRYRLPWSRKIMLRRALGWSSLFALVVWFLPNGLAGALLSGAKFMLVIHVLLILLPNLLLVLFRRDREREYRDYLETIVASTTGQSTDG